MRRSGSGLSREPGFEIWQSGSQIHSIDNPVRLEILRRLQEGPKSLPQLVAATGRAKSTLSAVHLPSLLEGGLVETLAVPTDNRTKLYRLTGERLGQSDVDAARLKNAVLRYAQRNGVVGVDALRLIDPAALIESGASDEFLDAAAARLGAAIARTLPPGPQAALDQVSALLAAEGLGRLRMDEDGATLECETRLAPFLLQVTTAALKPAGVPPPRLSAPPHGKPV